MMPSHPSTPATVARLQQQHQSKYHPAAIHHSHFAKHHEKEASSAVLQKTVLLGNAKGLFGDYRPDKIVTRTASSVKSRDSKTIAHERARRREQVLVSGFSSDIKEPYKPLGAPVLDTDELLMTALHLDPRTLSSSKPATTQAATAQRHSIMQYMKESQQRMRKGAPVVAIDDYEKLKNKLLLSKNRLHSVKFGIPLAQTMSMAQLQEAERLQREANERVGMALFGEEGFDWNPDKIDKDKMNYYLRVLDADAKSNEHKATSDITSARPNPNTSSPLVLATSIERCGHNQDTKTYDVEQLEEILQVKRPVMANPEQALNRIRESFNKDRRRMTEELNEELARLDRQRNSVFVQKYKAFQIGVNGICSTDMENMRKKAANQRLAEKTRLLSQHPWYNDLINKVVYGNGARKELTSSEHKMLKRVRSLIGDHVAFDKFEFAKLMKMVPPHDFMKDEVQRILKYLKQNCSLSELDFLDAIESSGQMLVASADDVTS